jgi:phosphatidylserine decarboxylase
MASTGVNYYDPTQIPVIVKLIRQAQRHPHFIPLLEASLQQANDIALRGSKGPPPVKPLDRDLYRAIKWWPTSFDEYLAYLAWFCRWIPHQSDHPGWKDPGTENYREPYDRLCHFYWLIDQNVGPKGSIIVENIPWFSAWLVEYANAWGEFLDTCESWNDELQESFIKYSKNYQVPNSLIGKPPRGNAPSGWKTFNQFFARELNGGLRPIYDPTHNSAVTSPADCTYKEQFKIGPDSKIKEIVVKGTHKYASIPELLKGSQYANAFAGGWFVHYFLAPYSYHRFHTPVAGVVKECYPVHGKVFLNVQLSGGQFDAPDASGGSGQGYEFVQARGIVTIDTAGSPYGDVGVIAVIPIGMCQVSGVNMTHEAGKKLEDQKYNKKGDKPCLKGDEFGYFTFGGSDIIVLFQEKAKAKIITETHYRHYGSHIATCK